MTNQSGGSANGLPVGGVLSGSLPNPAYVGGGSYPPLSLLFAQLGADVTLTPINTYKDILTLSLPAGTWLLLASVTVNQQTNSAGVEIALWDGTTYVGSGEAVILSSTNRATLTAMAQVSPSATTTYHLRGTSSALTCTALAAVVGNGVGNNATSFAALRSL